MKILALDIATSCGWAAGEAGSVPESGSFYFSKTGKKPKDKISNAAKFWHAIRYGQRVATEIKPDVVFIEETIAPNAMPGETQKWVFDALYGLPACIEGMLHGLGVYDIRRVHQNSIRKHFIGRGNLPGEEAKPKVWGKCLELGWMAIDDEDTSYDRSDALALWSWGEHQVAPRIATGVDEMSMLARKRGAA